MAKGTPRVAGRHRGELAGSAELDPPVGHDSIAAGDESGGGIAAEEEKDDDALNLRRDMHGVERGDADSAAAHIDPREHEETKGDAALNASSDAWSVRVEPPSHQAELSEASVEPSLSQEVMYASGRNVSARAASITYRAIARDGLNLRSGPGPEFGTMRSLPFGTEAALLKRDGAWALLDLNGDGAADGFVHAGFLQELSAPDRGPGTTPLAAGGEGLLGRVTATAVKAMFPIATPLRNIEANLPYVLEGLRKVGLIDRTMILMAFATIRAETESFRPIDEGISRYNTEATPFDKYDGRSDLGNSRPGDGPRFKGRGYVQLTGRANYTTIGTQIDVPLAANPQLANDPRIAGRILAQFLNNQRTRIRNAIRDGDLRLARRAVNGGSHGLDRFKDAFVKGRSSLPS